MSYVVLARKYRSRNFSEMVGQGHVVQALSNALTQQRLHHAYLFTGTRGVGKTTVSRILAKALNCTGPDGQGGITASPCGVCEACTEIDADRYVDYTEMDAASNRGIDDVRDLLERANYKPVKGRFKIYMIDEVHQLTKEAFAALLKTLEEPPEYLKFVLATTDPQKVPVTILSRCLQFSLRPMAPETVHEHLAHVLKAENVPIDDASLRLLSRAARGSMRDALSLTDQAIAFGSGRIEEDGVRRMLGSVDRGHVFKLVDALARGDGKTVVEITDGLRADGLSAASTLEEMVAVLQRMAVIQAVPAMADDTDPEAAEIAKLAVAMPGDETHLLYNMCLNGRTELGLASDEYAALTMVLLRLLAFKAPAEKKTLNDGAARPARAPSVPPAQESAPLQAPAPARAAVPVAAPIATGPRPASGSQAAPGTALVAPPQAQAPAPSAPPGRVLPVVEPRAERPRPRPPASDGTTSDVMGVPVRVQAESARDAQPAREPVLELTEEGDFWHGVVGGLVAGEAVTALVRELALQSQLVARDEGHWLLRVERESLNQPVSRDRLTAALKGAGHDVRLAVEIGHVVDSPARRNQVAAQKRQRAAEQIIEQDPFVQDMMREYGARIVPGSIKPV